MEKKNEQTGLRGLLGKKAWVFGGVAVLAAVVAVVAVVAGQGARGSNDERQYLKINTPYIDLLLPKELDGIVTSEEYVAGTVYSRTFYMNYEGKVLPLWQVVFGDSNAGDWVGTLKTDKGDIPVAMAGFVLNDEQQSDLGEKGIQRYGECMQGYVVMLDGIMADSRFTSERIGENIQMDLTYWSVTLPAGMTVSENTEGGNYEAVFSGEVVGEMVFLYRVYIGESQSGSLLGYFEVEGVKKPVYVESFTLAQRESWNEDDYATAYRMMETINDVIQQIMSSKNYSEFSE